MVHVIAYPLVQGILEGAFKLVAPRNWKDAIYKIVVVQPHQIPVIRKAVPFFTGSVPRIREIAAPLSKAEARRALGQITVIVEAAGYYATVGA